MIRRTVSLALLAVALILGAARATLAQTAPEVSPPLHDVYGTVLAVHGDVLSLRLRTDRTLAVDFSEARSLHHVVLLTPGRPVHVRGNPAKGGFHAVAVLKSHADPEFWPPDR
jgi:hypothetical protein